MADMPRDLPKHVSADRTRHGKVAFYVRTGKDGHGKRIRLRAPYGSDEWWGEYRAALEGRSLASEKRPGGVEGTLGWLIDRYLDSAPFAALKPGSQQMRHNILKKIKAAGGHAKLSTIDGGHIVAGRDARAATPSAARHFVTAWRKLYEWALEAQLVKLNIADGIKTKRPKTNGGFHTWTDDEVAKFEAYWPVGTMQRLAMDILLYSGLRRSDAYRLGPQHVRNGIITITMKKTGTVVTPPLLAPLKASIDATPSGQLTYLVNKWGRPFVSASPFSKWFRSACNKADLPQCSPHGLRKAGAVRAAEGGATTEQLKSFYGWKSSAEADIYVAEANRRKLARAAGERMVANR